MRTHQSSAVLPVLRDQCLAFQAGSWVFIAVVASLCHLGMMTAIVALSFALSFGRIHQRQKWFTSFVSALRENLLEVSLLVVILQLDYLFDVLPALSLDGRAMALWTVLLGTALLVSKGVILFSSLLNFSFSVGSATSHEPRGMPSLSGGEMFSLFILFMSLFLSFALFLVPGSGGVLLGILRKQFTVWMI
jgi:hypothetical protein